MLFGFQNVDTCKVHKIQNIYKFERKRQKTETDIFIKDAQLPDLW